MNRARRKELEQIVDSLEELRERLEAVRDEEQDAFDNMPESIQNGERGETMAEGIDALSDSLETVVYELQERLE